MDLSVDDEAKTYKNVVEKNTGDHCTGCGLCAEVCPSRCLRMDVDAEGFSYPQIEESACLDCGKCLSKCPLDKPFPEVAHHEGFVVRARDKGVLRKATSGGVFLPLSQKIIDSGGLVVGASYDDDWNVRHYAYSDLEESRRCQGSKYVQSDLCAEHIFATVKDALLKGRKVLFTGLPCQVAAMRSMFGANDDLLLVELVCHGVASPKAWRSYLAEMADPSSIESIYFRDKTYGYHHSTMTIARTNGKSYHKSAKVDPYLKAFFAGLMHRPICYQCPFKGLDRLSDLTIYDCTHFTELTGLDDDDCGYTNVMVNTERGRDVLLAAGDALEFVPVDYEKAVQLNGDKLFKCIAPHSGRPTFYTDLDKMTFGQAVSKSIRTSWIDRVQESLKPALHTLGLMRVLKKGK